MRTDDFLKRFAYFNDAVIREINVLWSSGFTAARFRIEAIDEQSATGWSQVELEVQGVTAFKFVENQQESHQVLFEDLSIRHTTDESIVIFDGGNVDPLEPIGQATSNFYVRGRSYSWRML
jgi:hypothetical protein